MRDGVPIPSVTMRWAEGGFMSYYILLLIKNFTILYVANNK